MKLKYAISGFFLILEKTKIIQKKCYQVMCHSYIFYYYNNKSKHTYTHFPFSLIGKNFEFHIDCYESKIDYYLLIFVVEKR